MSRNEAHRTIIQMLESDAPLCVVENIARLRVIPHTALYMSFGVRRLIGGTKNKNTSLLRRAYK